MHWREQRDHQPRQPQLSGGTGVLRSMTEQIAKEDEDK